MEAAMAADRPTRFAADLLESAAVEGRRESRSAKQQLDFWARVGRTVCIHESAARRRVEAALGGELALSELDDSERLVANAELDVTIQLQGEAISFGERLAAEGVTTVALADDGTLVEHRPDGSVAIVAGPTRAE
jgi:ParD-like antitoxin of type II bacterial toxin-antitoxin system